MPPAEGIDPLYAYAYFSSPVFQRLIIEKASTTTLPIINKSRFEELPIPVPPIEEQRAIARMVEQLQTMADELEQRIDFVGQTAELSRKAVIDRVFRGELSKPL